MRFSYVAGLALTGLMAFAFGGQAEAASLPPPPPKAAVTAGNPLGSRPGEDEVSSTVSATITACYDKHVNYSPENWAWLLPQYPSEAEQQQAFDAALGHARREIPRCLDDEALAVTGAADKSALKVMRGNFDAIVGNNYGAARQAVEANPANYLMKSMDGLRADDLRSDVNDLKNARTVAETCGTFDFTQPELSPSLTAYLASLNERRVMISQCAEKYRDDDRLTDRTFALESANKWVKATRRFTCSVNRRPNCLPDGPYEEVARIATDANVALVNRQDALLSNERSTVAQLLIERLNQWIMTLNARVGAHNTAAR